MVSTFVLSFIRASNAAKMPVSVPEPHRFFARSTISKFSKTDLVRSRSGTINRSPNNSICASALRIQYRTPNRLPISLILAVENLLSFELPLLSPVILPELSMRINVFPSATGRLLTVAVVMACSIAATIRSFIARENVGVCWSSLNENVGLQYKYASLTCLLLAYNSSIA